MSNEQVIPGHSGRRLPSGRAWFVTRKPCPRVVLHTDHLTVDGRRIEPAPGQTPRAAATAHLRELAISLRGADGAVRAMVVHEDSQQAKNEIVTGRGEVYDDTEPFDVPSFTGAASLPRRRPSRKLLFGAAAVAGIVVAATVIGVAVSRSSESAAATALPYSPSPTEYPLPAPAGYSQRADWSAPIAAKSIPAVASTGQVIALRAGEVVALDARTGALAWSSALPADAAAAAEAGGTRLSLIDGAESLVAGSEQKLWWWPVSGATHDVHSVDLPSGATVTFAGSTPLATAPDQHAQLIADGRLRDYVVPPGAVAMAGQDDAIIAANSAGQVWTLTPATATQPAAPWQVPAPAGANALQAPAGFIAPFGGGDPARHGVLVLLWYTPDANTRQVSAVDVTSHAELASAVRVPAAAVAAAAVAHSPHGVLGLFGPVLVNADTGQLYAIDSSLARSLLDTAAYGLAKDVASAVAPDGRVSPAGTGVLPVGVSGGMAVVLGSPQEGGTVYGLPARDSAAPSAESVPAAPLNAAGPTPAAAASPPPPPPPPPPPSPPR